MAGGRGVVFIVWPSLAGGEHHVTLLGVAFLNGPTPGSTAYRVERCTGDVTRCGTQSFTTPYRASTYQW